MISTPHPALDVHVERLSSSGRPFDVDPSDIDPSDIELPPTEPIFIVGWLADEDGAPVLP
jgi:hypothetical protein